MSAIKNKTSLSVGDSVYGPTLGAWEVKVLTPLSDKIVYVQIEHQYDNGSVQADCAMLNAAKADSLCAFGYREAFYLSMDDAQKIASLLRQDRKRSVIGTFIIEAFEELKRL